MIFGRNKKGNAVIEGITIVVLMFVLGIAGVYSYYIFDQLNTELVADEDINVEAKTISSSMFAVHKDLMDNLFLFAYILFILFTIVSAFIIDSHPIFFAISIILLIGVFVVAGLMANAYDDVMQDGEIAPYANEFVFTTWVMSHLLEQIIALVFIITIVIFVKIKT